MSWTIFYTTEQGEATIEGCFGSDPALSLPNEIDGCPVVRLGPGCFGAALDPDTSARGAASDSGTASRCPRPGQPNPEASLSSRPSPGNRAAGGWPAAPR